MTKMNADDLRIGDVVIAQVKIHRFSTERKEKDQRGRWLPLKWPTWKAHYELESIARLYAFTDKDRDGNAGGDDIVI